MSPRKPYCLFALGVLLLLGTIEVGLSYYRGSLGCVLVINEGTEPIEDLRLLLNGEEAKVTWIEAGGAAKVYLGGSGKNDLKLKYRQRGSPLTGFEIAGFEPEALAKDGFRLELRIRPDEFERSFEDEDPSMLVRVASGAKRWLVESLESP